MRAGAIVVSTVVMLVTVSTVTHLCMGVIDTTSAEPYGDRLSIRGGQVNVSVTGHGDQTVVLLGGYGTASPVLDFTPLTQELDDDYTVIVVERFGYGYSDLGVPGRTVQNVSSELHSILTKLAVEDYVLVAHSMAAIYSLDYVNRFPGEVSALVTLDGTVPRDFATPPTIGLWQRLLSETGWVRWMTALDPTTTTPSAPSGMYSADVAEHIRVLTISNYANPSLIDENNRAGENFSAVSELTYPAHLPVLAFLSQQTIDLSTEWRPAHEQQLKTVENAQLVVLDGGHYLHWTHSEEIAERLRAFISEAVRQI